MNPFLEWLNSLFKKKEFEMPTPNSYPQYERGPVTAEEVSPEAWNQRLASPLADSLRQMGPFFQPKPRTLDMTPGGPMGIVERVPGNVAVGAAFNTNPKAYGRFEPPVNQEANQAFTRYRQTPAENVFDPRRTMIHEYGHIANSLDGSIPESSVPFKMMQDAELFKERAGLGKTSLPLNIYDFPRVSDWASPGYRSISTPEYKAVASIDPYSTMSPREAFAQAFVNAFEFLAETAREPKMDYRKFAGDLEANTPGMGLIIRDMLKLPLYKNHPLRGQIFTEKKK
jgi:hypothetical protein